MVVVLFIFCVTCSQALRAALTLEVTGDVVLDLVVARRAEEQSPVHQRKLFEHRQRPVAQRAVDHVPLARAEGRQDEPAGTGHIMTTPPVRLLAEVYLKLSFI